MSGYYDRDRRERNALGAPQSFDSQTPAGHMNHPYTHHGNVAEYQASGIPYAITFKASTTNTKISFPYVTQWIQVICNDTDKVVYMAFSSTGKWDGTDDSSSADPSPNNYIEMHTPASNTGATDGHNVTPVASAVWRLKCKEINIKASGNCSVSIIAGLTSVRASEFPSLDGLDGIG